MTLATVKILTKSTPHSVLARLSNNALFCGLPAPLLREVAEFCKLRQVEDGALIHGYGDAPDGMYLIVSGGMRATVSSSEGREGLLAVMQAGAWFGESSLFDGLPRAYEARAEGETLLVFVPSAGMHRLLLQRPELYRNLVPLLCQRIRLSLALLQTNALLPLEGRLAQRLLLLTGGSGPDTQDEIRLSQEDLSQMMAVTRQSINRVLKLWQREGVIECHYRSIRICDRANLRAKMAQDL
jgi:CRP/FNR family cyclic AMP-dependent transcriptional regulator